VQMNNQPSVQYPKYTPKPPSPGTVDPVYPETYLMPGRAQTKGASIILNASYKASRTSGGLKVGKEILRKTAVKVLKKGGDVFSSSNSEAKSKMKDAK